MTPPTDRRPTWRLLTPCCLLFLLFAGGVALGTRPMPAGAAPRPAGANTGDQGPKAGPTAAPCSTLGGAIISSPNITRTLGPPSLYAVAAVAPNDVWAVGMIVNNTYRYETLTLHWDGLQWSRIPSPNTGGADNVLTAVAAVSANDVWAVGYRNSQTLILHWNGANWAVVPSPSPGIYSRLAGVAAVGPNDAWAVGLSSPYEEKETPLTLHWDGTAWTVVPSPSFAIFDELRAVTAIAPNDAWAGGGISGNGASYGPLALHWDGTAWTRVPISGTSWGRINGVAAAAANDVWAVTDGGQTLHWNGTQWSTVPNPGGARLLSVAAITANDAWAVGSSTAGSAVTLHWDGAQWTDVPNTGNAGLSGVAALGAADVWAVGGNAIHWQGNTWTPTPLPAFTSTANTLRGVAARAGNDVWAVGNYGPSFSKSITQHWDGQAWSIVTSPQPGTANNLYGVAAAAADEVWAVGNMYDGTAGYFVETLIEHWNGSAWSVVPSPNVTPGDSRLTDVAARAANDVWAVGSSHYVEEETLVLHYDGTQWSIIPSPTPPGWYVTLAGVAARAADDAWAVGHYRLNDSSPEQTLVLHWDGTTWSIIPSPNVGTDRNKLTAVAAVAADDVWAVGYAGPPGTGQTLILHWDGAAWSIVPSPNPTGAGFLFDVTAVSADNVWAVGNYIAGTGPAQTLALRWDGTQWAAMSSSNVAGRSNYLFAVAAVNADEIWSVGSYQAGDDTLTLVEQFGPPSFSDVHPADYFYPAVRYLACQGVIAGYADGTFRPYSYTTRGQLTKIVVLAAGWPLLNPTTPTFSDVPPSQPFYRYIETAAAQGIIAGYAGGTFRPGADVTRAQLTKIVVLAQGWPPAPPPTPTFSDVPASHPFYPYVETAYQHGIISGYADGTFRPGAAATRGQIAKIVYSAISTAAVLENR